jgi:hypothetical protein
MKKMFLLGAMSVALVGVAFASSIAVPFFQDNAPATPFPPTTGTAAFVGLHNNTDGPITCYVTYMVADATTGAGIDVTPEANSFTLPAYGSISFRPFATATNEGAGSIVPNMTGTKANGAATITWDGDPTDVQGRLTEIKAASSSDTSSYTLPAGVEPVAP